MRPRTSKVAVAALTCAGALTLAAIISCSSTADKSALVRPAGEPGVGQQQFDTDDHAAAALVAAAKARDHDALNHMFGPSVSEFISGDKVEDEKSFDQFVKSASDHLELEKKDANTSFIDIGKDNWPFPIPLTRLSSGKWFFDTEVGKQEILARRIGANELETIKVCRAYVEAQREYASVDREGDGVLKYAQHFMSKNGKDGLYWEAGSGEPESPIGPFVAAAATEGYANEPGRKSEPFHGYYFRVLKGQGANEPGGARSYIVEGRMTGGFGFVAYPADYRSSGVMTFIVDQDGLVYQKDLGPRTAQLAKSLTRYDRDATWQKD